MRTLIEGRGLRKRYGRRASVEALRGVDLAVRSGEVVALVGPNGAGKSSLLRLLAGALRPDGGDVFLLGSGLRSAPAGVRRRLRRRVGFVPEVPVVLDHLTGREYLAVVAVVYGVTGEERDARVERSLRHWGLGDAMDAFARTYSQGMLKRLALAAATVFDPDVLLLDEPLNFLDVAGQELMREAVRETAARGGGVLLSTHVLEAVEGVATRAVVISGGRIRAEIPSDELADGGWDRVRRLLREEAL